MRRKALYSLIFWSIFSTSAFCYRDEAFERNLTNLQYDGVTHTQILAWWEVYKRGRLLIRNSTRVIPLCVGRAENGDYPPKLLRWAPILDNIALKDERNYDPGKLLFYRNSPIFEYQRVFIIKQEKPGESENQFSLFLWFHMRLEFKKPVSGLLVQGMTGPLGVPGLEFVDIPCKEHSYPSPGVSFQPCSFAPRSSSVWPNIHVYEGPPTRALFFSFRWNEAQCQETGFFQLIYIVTNSFTADDYEVRMSGLLHYSSFERTFKSTDFTGLFTPAYLGFPSYKCHESTLYGQGDSRLLPNLEYDECVTKGVGRKSGMWGWTCPPGPFECSTMWEKEDEWTVRRKDWINLLASFNKGKNITALDCCEIGEIPVITTTTTGEPTTDTPPTVTLAPEEKKEKELEVRVIQAEIRSKVTHGGLCICTWLVVIPLADHIGRFYKDFPDFKSLGLGIWIIGHVILHCLALIMIWCSFGLVIGTGENSLGDVSTKHFLLGTLAILLQHGGFVSALKLFKDVRESVAFKYLAAHSLGGKIAYLTAFFAIILSSASNEMKGMSFLLVCIYLGVVGVSMYFEHKQHDILGVGVHRARCPVLQRIVMEDDAHPPMMKQKIVVIVAMAGLLFGVYVFMEIVFRNVKHKS